MKFRFIGGLDCPDWVLTQIAEFAEISPNDFKRWCLMIADRLKFNQTEWTEESLRELTGHTQIELRCMKAMIAALSFILEKAAKNACSAVDLEAEMLQLGFSAEHAKQLFLVYSSEMAALQSILTKKFVREPSFCVLKQTSQIVDGVQVKQLKVRTSDGKCLNLAIGEQKLQLLSKGIQEALLSLEPFQE
uniref:COMM domain-containing protein n=1 Tax=Ditylenchus dipsaci TaxID=166011 RepID=A0A915ELF6_9BILA